ncbi:Down syndrome cell adhesion molecule-like protein 1 [Orchesella cincta]|uniref:Down syndrome cell adhesion molecule-like protein 1 n=1 Tax=Orchesella cincta TaxID=48709 RepID=A0A1D2N9W1_ORCCI|nr:Down syndrome cell adhesion molecule-like protein 1 [Orchesella cincta]
MNKIGGGPPSETISVTTKGSRPIKPTAAHFLQSNSSSITLNLVAWNSSDCPVSSFVIEYKPRLRRAGVWFREPEVIRIVRGTTVHSSYRKQ